MDITTALRGTLSLDRNRSEHASATLEQLRHLLARIALRPETWAPLVRYDRHERWYERLLRTDAAEVWLIGWRPGQWTPVHDHGGALGAVTVLGGALTEERADPASSTGWMRRTLTPGTTLEVASEVVHRVGNAGPRLATSIHAYSPPGVDLRVYRDGAGTPSRRAG